MATAAEVDAALDRYPRAGLILDADGTRLADRDFGPGPWPEELILQVVVLGPVRRETFR